MLPCSGTGGCEDVAGRCERSPVVGCTPSIANAAAAASAAAPALAGTVLRTALWPEDMAVECAAAAAAWQATAAAAWAAAAVGESSTDIGGAVREAAGRAMEGAMPNMEGARPATAGGAVAGTCSTLASDVTGAPATAPGSVARTMPPGGMGTRPAAAAAAAAAATAIAAAALEPAIEPAIAHAGAPRAAVDETVGACAVDEIGEEGTGEEVADAGAGRLRPFLGEAGEAAPAAAAAAAVAAATAAAAAGAADATATVRDAIPWGGSCSAACAAGDHWDGLATAMPELVMTMACTPAGSEIDGNAAAAGGTTPSGCGGCTLTWCPEFVRESPGLKSAEPGPHSTIGGSTVDTAAEAGRPGAGPRTVETAGRDG